MTKKNLLMLFIICLLMLLFVSCKNQITIKPNPISGDLTSEQTLKSGTEREETEAIISEGATEVTTTPDTSESLPNSEASNFNINLEPTEVELLILKLFKGSETSEEDRHKIFEVIDQMNWSKYDQLTMKMDYRCDDLLYWLSTINLEEDDDILSILNATDGLDGYMSESYSYVVSQIYLDEPKRMIRLMSTLNDDAIEYISGKIVYGLGGFSLEDIHKMVSDVEMLIGNDVEFVAEKKVIEMLKFVVKKQQEDIMNSQ